MEEGRGGGGKVKRIILREKIFLISLILIQARDVSANVEVGQGGQPRKHPSGSLLLSSLQGREANR